jgi:hypothetical protein
MRKESKLENMEKRRGREERKLVHPPLSMSTAT